LAAGQSLRIEEILEAVAVVVDGVAAVLDGQGVHLGPAEGVVVAVLAAAGHRHLAVAVEVPGHVAAADPRLAGVHGARVAVAAVPREAAEAADLRVTALGRRAQVAVVAEGVVRLPDAGPSSLVAAVDGARDLVVAGRGQRLAEATVAELAGAEAPVVAVLLPQARATGAADAGRPGVGAGVQAARVGAPRVLRGPGVGLRRRSADPVLEGAPGHRQQGGEQAVLRGHEEAMHGRRQGGSSSAPKKISSFV
jgi:hypothetical protein